MSAFFAFSFSQWNSTRKYLFYGHKNERKILFERKKSLDLLAANHAQLGKFVGYASVGKKQAVQN